MKKTVLLSTLALSATIAAMAQSHHTLGKFPVAGDHAAHVASKTTTGNAARLIASAFTVHAGPLAVLLDTSSYAYSGTRGGSVLTGVLKYDSTIEFQGGLSGLTPAQKSAQTFDAYNNILTNTTQQWDASLSVFGYSSKSTYTYDANNNMLTETDQMWDSSTNAWVNVYKYTYTYTSFNKMSTRLEQGWSGAWMNSYFDTFTYNSSNLQVQDLSKNWNSSTSAWDTSSRDTFTYDGSGNMLTDVYQNWDPTVPGWVTQFKTTYSNYFAPGAFQMVIGQQYTGSAFQNDYKDSITYNSYNQPDLYFERNWSPSTGSWIADTFYQGHFYYEIYSNSVSQINNAAAALNVYPNPASGLINISVDAAGGKNTTITLQDVTGRVVRTIDGSNFKAGVNTIQCATDELAAGTYFIHMANDKANVTRKVVIAK